MQTFSDKLTKNIFQSHMFFRIMTYGEKDMIIGNIKMILHYALVSALSMYIRIRDSSGSTYYIDKPSLVTNYLNLDKSYNVRHPNPSFKMMTIIHYIGFDQSLRITVFC